MSAPFDIDAWTAKVRSGPPPQVSGAPVQPHLTERDCDCDDEDDGERELDDCPQCGSSGQYDDCTPCSYCDGEGIAPWDW